MDKRDTIEDYLLRHLKETFHDPVGSLSNPFLVPGAGYPDELWGWDAYWVGHVLLFALSFYEASVLEGCGLSRKEVIAHIQGTVNNFLNAEDRQGYIPPVLSDKGLFAGFFAKLSAAGLRMNQHSPFLAQLTEECSLFLDDYRWFDLDRLVAYLDKYEQTQLHKPTGLYYWHNDLLIGVDNNPTVFGRPDDSSADIFLNCFLYRELESLSRILGKLGDERAKTYKQRASSLSDAINRVMYDEREGLYFSQDLLVDPSPKEIGGIAFHSAFAPAWGCLPIKIRFFGCFLPLYCRLVPVDRVKRMVSHLEGDDFLARYGLRTLAKTERMYSLFDSPGNPSNWLGPSWTVATYLVYKGLRNYREDDLADRLLEKTIDLLGGGLENGGALYESYDPDDGHPFRHPGFLSFNALALEMIADE